MKKTIVSLLAVLTLSVAWAQTLPAYKAYFPLNGNVKDSSGNTSGAKRNGTAYAYDRNNTANRAMVFAGSKVEYVDLNDSFTFPTTTISLWLNPDYVSTSTNPVILLSNLANLTQFTGTGLEIYLYANGKVEVLVGNVTSPPKSYMKFITKSSIPFKKWTHFALAIDSMQTIKLYINCKRDTTYSMKGLPSFTTSKYMMHIGARAYPHYENPYTGILDEIKIFNKLLTDNQVTGLYRDFTTSKSVTTCNSYKFGKKTYTSSGTYYDTLRNVYGCDSIISLNLKLNKSNGSQFSITACDSYKFKGNTITSSGNYYDFLVNYLGCDSIITYNIKINKSNGSSDSIAACNSYFFNGNLLTLTGTYYDTLKNVLGCDSIIKLKLTIKKSSKKTIDVTTCNSYLFNGNILKSSGIYYDTLINSYGCDSFLTLNLTINRSNSGSFSVSACNNYFFNDNILKSSGIYYDTLTNIRGCDSFLTLNLTIYKTNGYNFSISTCNKYFFNGNTIKASGIYFDTLTNYYGCDSFVRLNLTINQPTSSSNNITACNSYIFGGNILTMSGTYRDTLPNTLNCDSVITLNLTINTVNTSVIQTGNILTAIESGAAYQWVDCNKGFSVIPNETKESFSATVNGQYAAIISKNNCTDTSSCYTVNSIGLPVLFPKSEIQVYPNPNDGEITIKFGEKADIKRLIITNLMGQTVYENSVNQTLIKISIEGEPGFYCMTLIDADNMRSNIKLLKK